MVATFVVPPNFQEQPRAGVREVGAVLSDAVAVARHDAPAHHHAAQPLLQGTLHCYPFPVPYMALLKFEIHTER